MTTKEQVKHTPGPWSLFEPSPTETTQLIGNGTIHIADIYMTDFPVAMADARLIAAAPELLAALEQVWLELIDMADAAGDDDHWNKGGSAYEVCQMVKKAIRKARGDV